MNGTSMTAGPELAAAQGQQTIRQRRRDGRARGALVTAAGGVDLFVQDWGDGAPILLLSGWTLNSEMWGYQMTPLAQQGFRCVVYDRREHGRSSDPGGGYDFDTQCARDDSGAWRRR